MESVLLRPVDGYETRTAVALAAFGATGEPEVALAETGGVGFALVAFSDLFWLSRGYWCWGRCSRVGGGGGGGVGGGERNLPSRMEGGRCNGGRGGGGHNPGGRDQEGLGDREEWTACGTLEEYVGGRSRGVSVVVRVLPLAIVGGIVAVGIEAVVVVVKLLSSIFGEFGASSTFGG